MSNLRVAKRYASALMVLTGEAKHPEPIADDLLTVQSAITSSKELRSLLASPIVSKEKKKAVIAELFSKKIGTEVSQYLAAIIEKRRENVLPEVLEQYFLLRDEQLGIVSVTVRSAVKFSAEQEKSLVRQLESFTQKKVPCLIQPRQSFKGRLRCESWRHNAGRKRPPSA